MKYIIRALYGWLVQEPRHGFRWVTHDLRSLNKRVQFVPHDWVRPPFGHGPITVFADQWSAMRFGLSRLDSEFRPLKPPYIYEVWRCLWLPARVLGPNGYAVWAPQNLPPYPPISGQGMGDLAPGTCLARAVKLVERVRESEVLDWFRRIADAEDYVWGKRKRGVN